MNQPQKILTQSFTAEWQEIAQALITDIGVSLPHQQNSTNTLPFKGLWDTGATTCAITSMVAKAIGARPVSKIIVKGVHGPQPCNQYLINIYLPNHIRIDSIPAMELFDNDQFDALIGMNVISLGDFSISNLDGKTSFTFRMPSCQKPDFVKYWPKDTTVCTCGSGSQFKNCCKKLIQNMEFVD